MLYSDAIFSNINSREARRLGLSSHSEALLGKMAMPSAAFAGGCSTADRIVEDWERAKHRVTERRSRSFANPALAYLQLRVLSARSIAFSFSRRATLP